MPLSVMINGGRLHHSNPDEDDHDQFHLILHLIPIVSPPLSPSALHELRCPSDSERILPNPPSGATPSLCGWSTGRSLLVWCCSGHDKGTKRFQGQRFTTERRRRARGAASCVIPHQRVVAWDSWVRRSWGGGPEWPSWCWDDGERCPPSETASPPGKQ